jgi:HD superfamily phosphohydrolase
LLSLRDPVHVYVRADELEARLIESRPMHRLRWVRQLGLAHLVFPGAEHSRFSHVLGAMHLAGQVYDSLAERAPDLLDKDPRCPERRLLRLAALLHDIGHAPFSHSAEELFEQGISHEEMTLRLLDTAEMRDSLRTAGAGIDAQRLASLLDGTGTEADGLLGQVISSELDVDKMDYLLRDSLFCGVRYGSYDLGRLLETLVPLRDPTSGEWGLGIEEGGVHALEALVLARYYMFTQVYFNPTGKVLELHLNEWLANEGVRWAEEPDAFLAQDDITIWAAMRSSSSPHARAISERSHHALAFETREHLTPQESESFAALAADVEASFQPGDLLVSNSAKDPHRLAASRVLVRHGDGRLEPMESVSNFIRHLTRIDRFRVYTRPDLRDEVGEIFSRRWAAEPAPPA